MEVGLEVEAGERSQERCVELNFFQILPSLTLLTGCYECNNKSRYTVESM